MILRVLIADDEPLARGRLRELLLAEPDVEIVGECSSGKETLKAVRKESPHLLLLDIRMPELDGFEVVRALGTDRLPIIVFVTAYDQYALRAFEACAVDFLLKPFDRERFRESLRRAREMARRGGQRKSGAEILDVVAALKARPKLTDRFAVRSGGRVIFVKTREIEWVQSADNYAELHVGNTVLLLRQSLGALQQQLPPDSFFRISRSVIVNLDRVKELHPKSHGDFLIVLKDGTRLPGSRNYRAGLPMLSI
jgi:two-component system LytT family response regulator